MTYIAPPLRAVGRSIIEIYGPVAWSGKWDEALWGSSFWGNQAWHDITPQSMVCKISWGADDPAGVLTVPAAGSWNIDTYDPERMLDPGNQSSPYAISLKPGKAIRVSVIENGVAEIVRQGLIDEVGYDLYEKRGTLRGTDMVPLIVNAKLDAGQNDDPDLPDTLRARAQYLLAKVGLDKLVPLQQGPQLAPNPSFETLASGTDDDPLDWNASNSNFEIRRTSQNESQEAAHPTPDGQYICRIECLVAGTGGAISTVIPAVPGAKYKASAYAMIGSGAVGRMARVRVTGHDAGGAQVGTIEQHDVVIVNTGYTLIEAPEFVFPDDGVQVSMKLAVMIVAGLPGEFIRVDMAQLFEVPYDPPVGPLPNDNEASVWSLISTSAYDALYAMWMDRFGRLCFRSFGAPVDNGFTVGGDEGIPISTIKPQTSLENVYTAVHAHDMDLIPPNDEVHATNPEAVDIYGLITLTRNKPVPNAQAWVDSVLADRAGASLQYETGTLFPRDISELQAILNLGMVDIMHLVADDVTPSLAVAARVLGGKLTLDTGTGFTAEVTGYIPGSEWEEQIEPPPIPTEPPTEPEPPPTQKVQRIYDAVKDTRAARTSGGANYGSGTEGELPVGAWQGWRNRSFIDFADIPMGDVVSIDKATLELDTSSQVNIGFGSSPKIIVKRVTASWNEGSLSSPGSGNSTVYPGPAVSSSDQVTATITRSENAAVGIVITGIARRWKEGQPQHGVGLFSAGEDSTAYTTEFLSRENGTASRRPRLVLDLTVTV